MQSSSPGRHLSSGPEPSPSLLFTARLALRALAVGDYRDIALAATPDLAGEVAAGLDTSIAIVVRDWIEHACAEVRAERELAFTIRREVAQQTLGVVSLRNIDRRERRAQLGFWLRMSARGRGYATEAARAVLTYAFDVTGLSHVDSFQAVGDEARGRVLARLGFTCHGLVESALVSMTRRQNAFLWSLHAADMVV